MTHHCSNDEIEGFYAAENWQDYTIKVHALKSSARIIGAVSFGEEAQLLENAGKSGDLTYIHEHHTGFMEKCRSFKAPLAEVFAAAQEEDKQVEDKPEADADLLAAVYEEIRTAAEDMDCDRLEDIFTEMEEYSMPAQEKEKWKQLKVMTSLMTSRRHYGSENGHSQDTDYRFRPDCNRTGM